MHFYLVPLPVTKVIFVSSLPINSFFKKLRIVLFLDLEGNIDRCIFPPTRYHELKPETLVHLDNSLSSSRVPKVSMQEVHIYILYLQCLGFVALMHIQSL